MMLFTLFNTSASFENYISMILKKKVNNLITIYFNNIFIYTKDLD